MKNLFGLFLLFTAVCTANGQINSPTYSFKVDTNELYYFTCNGLRITSSVYEFGQDYFYGNRVLVKRNGKFGYLNRKGEEVIAPKYDNATSFSTGNKAVVFYDCKTAIIDTTGALTFLEKEYYFVQPFLGNFAKVNDRWYHYGLINAQGKEVIQPLYRNLGNFANGYAEFSDTLTNLHGILDTTGKIVMPAKYYDIHEHSFFFTVEDKIKRGKILEGLANHKGQLVVPAKYNNINFDYPSLLEAETKASLIIATNVKLRRRNFSRSQFDDSKKVKKVDIYTTNGELLFSDKGAYWRPFAGLTAFKNSKAGLTIVNINKEKIVYKDYMFRDINSILENYFIINKKPKYKYDFYTQPALVDSLGHLVLDTVYSAIRKGQFGGAYCIIAQKGDSTTFFDYKLKAIKTIPYKFVYSTSVSVNGIEKPIYLANTGKLACVLDDKLEVLFPPKYQMIGNADNMFRTYQDKKQGMLDSTFKEVFAPQYSHITFLKKYNVFKLYNINKEGIAINTGKIILPPIYDYIKVNNDDWYSDDNKYEKVLFYITKIGKRYGLADSTGKTILENKYKHIDYEGGRIEVSDKNKIGYFNKSLQQLTPFIYNKIEFVYRAEDYKYFVVKQGKKYGLLDSLGQTVFDVEYDHLDPVYTTDVLFLVKNHKEGVYTTGKEMLIPIEYDAIYYREKYLVVRKKKQYGVFSSRGKELLPCSYRSIADWGNNLFLLQNKVGKKVKFGVANERGKIIVPVEYNYDDLRYSNSTVILTVDGKKYFYNSEGEPTNDCYIDKHIGTNGLYDDYDY